LPWLKYIIVALVIILILAGVFYFYFYDKSSKEDSILNNEDNLAVKEYINSLSETELNSPLNIIWESNNKIDVNLNTYFSDPDNDKLVFSTNAIENINTNVNGSVLTLTPDLNFVGIRKMTLIADDGENKVESDKEITLAVFYDDATVFNKVSNFIKVYFNFIIIGFVLIIIIILFLVFNKPIIDYLTEEEDEK
ncbi:hypothetical protein ACFL1H_07965, partial [Nanoarchaeota archaeon]